VYDSKRIADLAFGIKRTTFNPIFWNRQIMNENINNISFDFNEYLNKVEILKLALKSLFEFGITILNNVILFYHMRY
jgi:hypothetical protein